MDVSYENNIYIIDKDFHLVEFDREVLEHNKEIQIGDICYQAIMNRESPCEHCPIAGNLESSSIVYYDSLYDGFVEAAFCELSGGNYCVTRHKIGVENEHMQKQVEKSIGFFNAFSHVFISTYYVEFSTGTYSVFNREHLMERKYNNNNKWESFDDYIRQFIHEKDQEKLFQASRIETMRERLKEENRYSVVIRERSEKGGRWLRFEVNRGIDEDHAAVSFMDVSEEKETKIRLEQTDIVKALSLDFTEISQIDLKNNSSIILKLRGELIDYDSRHVNRYDETWADFTEKYVHPDEKKSLLQNVSKASLEAALKSNDTLVIPFKVVLDGKIRHCQVKFVKVGDDEGQLIMGIRSADV